MNPMILRTLLLCVLALSAISGCTMSPVAVRGAVSLTVAVDTAEVYFGEPFHLTLTLTNHTDEPITVSGLWAQDRMTIRTFRDGELITEFSPWERGLLVSEPHVVIEPGKAIERRVEGFEWVRALPGEHRLKLTFESTGVLRGSEVAVWKGKAQAQAAFTIKPLADDNDIAALRLAVLSPLEIEEGKFRSIWWPAYDSEDRMEAVLREYPDSIFAKHAHWVLANYGATWFTRHNIKFEQVQQHLKVIIEHWPDSHITADARLLLARALLERANRYDGLEDVEPHRTTAITHLRHLIKHHPNTRHAAEARQLIETSTSDETAAPNKNGCNI